LPDDDKRETVTHFCPPGLEKPLSDTVRFFSMPYDLYEQYLEANFPYPSLQQVFVPVDAAPRSSQVAAGLHIASSHLLVAPRVLTQGAECRIRLARALAQQWFGSFLMPESAADAWVTEGLAAFLTDLCVTKLLGSPEVQWRRYHERRAVVAADNGVLPPLHPREGQGWTASNVECPALGSIRRMKAKLVMVMLEGK